jgi:hypothetical protein
MLQTFFNNFSLWIQNRQNVSTYEQLLMTLQVDSITNLPVRNKQLHTGMLVVRRANDHAIGVKSSKWPGFQVGHDNNFALHVFMSYEFL